MLAFILNCKQALSLATVCATVDYPDFLKARFVLNIEFSYLASTHPRNAGVIELPSTCFT
jgi:hypothetical protein